MEIYRYNASGNEYIIADGGVLALLPGGALHGTSGGMTERGIYHDERKGLCERVGTFTFTVTYGEQA